MITEMMAEVDASFNRLVNENGRLRKRVKELEDENFQIQWSNIQEKQRAEHNMIISTLQFLETHEVVPLKKDKDENNT